MPPQSCGILDNIPQGAGRGAGMPCAKEGKTMTPKVWAVALLSLGSVPALFPDGAFAQGLTAGQCEVFGQRGLIDDATRQACCRVHNMWCTIPTFGGGAG